MIDVDSLEEKLMRLCGDERDFDDCEFEIEIAYLEDDANDLMVRFQRHFLEYGYHHSTGE